MELRGLFVCGILASLLYVAMNVYVPPLFEGYSMASHTVSESSAIGAPTRPLWVSLGTVYSLLVIAFGWGVRSSAGRNRPLRVVGVAMLDRGIVSLYWPPMHLRGPSSR
jgi:sulfite exporter TauE/SafE